MAVKKGLGRGLDMLIPKTSAIPEDSEVSLSNEYDSEKTEKKGDILLDINKIEPNRDQPRKQFDEDAIEELADSIKQFGVLQPLIVKKRSDYYEIIAGERRWRACKKAGIKEVPVIIRDYDEKEILKISLIENIQRENLNPIEEAQAYQKLKKEYHLKQDEIAASVSKSRTVITNTMRLLKLDERVQTMVLEGIISGGHGRTILAVEDHDLQYKIALKILDEGLSVREAEKLVKKYQNISQEEETEEEEKISQNERLAEQMARQFEERMKSVLGSQVKIKNKKNNKGKIEIEYYSQAELERIIDLIQSIQNS